MKHNKPNDVHGEILQTFEVLYLVCFLVLARVFVLCLTLGASTLREFLPCNAFDYVAPIG